MQGFGFLFSRLLLREKLFLSLPVLILALAHSLLYSSFCIFNGLHQDFFTQIHLRYPHIIIHSPETRQCQPLLEFAHKNSLKAQPIVLSQGFLQTNQVATPLLLRGIKPEHPLLSQNKLPKSTGLGVLNLLISESLLKELDLKLPLDGLILLADGSRQRVQIGASFNDGGSGDLKYSALLDYDQFQPFVYENPELWTKMEIRLDSIMDAPDLAQKLKSTPSLKDVKIETWKDHFQETLLLFEAQNRIHHLLFLLLMILIAASSYSAFFLVFLKKQNSLLSLYALGLSQDKLKQFLSLSVHFLLLCATALSTILAFGFMLYLKFEPIPLPLSLFYSDVLPFHWEWPFWALTLFFLYLSSFLAIQHSRWKVFGF